MFFKTPGCGSHVAWAIAQAQTLWYLKLGQGPWWAAEQPLHIGVGSSHAYAPSPWAPGLSQRELLLLLLRQFGPRGPKFSHILNIFYHLEMFLKVLPIPAYAITFVCAYKGLFEPWKGESRCIKDPIDHKHTISKELAAPISCWHPSSCPGVSLHQAAASDQG